MIAGIVTAFRTLTIFPVPGRDAEDMADSLPWFAVVGCVMGFIVYGLCRLTGFVGAGAWPEGVAVVALVAGTVLTRGLHLDGLADSADAFGSISDKHRTLQIMKDPHVGVFGVLALVTVLIAKWVAFTRLAAGSGLIWIAAAYIVSRTSTVELAGWLPYARPEGGTGAAFVQNAGRRHRLWALFSALALLLVIYGSAGALLLGVGWIVSRLFGLWCRRRVGGVTGDLLGACSEIVETVILVVCAAVPGRLVEFADWGLLLR